MSRWQEGPGQGPGATDPRHLQDSLYNMDSLAHGPESPERPLQRWLCLGCKVRVHLNSSTSSLPISFVISGWSLTLSCLCFLITEAG